MTWMLLGLLSAGLLLALRRRFEPDQSGGTLDPTAAKLQECPRCGHGIAVEWTFCPFCARALASSTDEIRQPGTTR